jgi:hypothetical protein
VASRNNLYDDQHLYMFSDNQFTFKVPYFKWKKSLFLSSSVLDLESLKAFLGFLQQPVSPGFLDIFSNTSHLADHLDIQITSLHVGPSDNLDDTFMTNSVIKPINLALSKMEFILKSEVKLQVNFRTLRYKSELSRHA